MSYLRRAEEHNRGHNISDEERKNIYEVIRKYQEKQKNNPYKSNQIRKKEEPNTNTNSSSSSMSVRAGHQRPMSRIIKDLTPEERRAGGMLDALERDKEYNRGHNISDEERKNIYGVIREYQEKQKNNPNKSNQIRKNEKPNTNTNSSSSSMSGRAGHQRPMSRIINDLTPEERRRAGRMLDALERDSGHNRGRGRGR